MFKSLQRFVFSRKSRYAFKAFSKAKSGDIWMSKIYENKIGAFVVR